MGELMGRALWGLLVVGGARRLLANCHAALRLPPSVLSQQAIGEQKREGPGAEEE